jgi:GNAT superfamily N-acetyltransferase
VAFAVVDLTRANVWALFVEPACEGQGLGRKLHDTMMAWVFSEGASNVWLTTAPGTRAERFYKTAGWQYSGPEPSGEARYEMPRGLERPITRCYRVEVKRLRTGVEDVRGHVSEAGE